VNPYDAVNYGQLSDLAGKVDKLDVRVSNLELNGTGADGEPYFDGTDVAAPSATEADAGTGTANVSAGSGASIASGVNRATVVGSNARVTMEGGVEIGQGAAATATNAVALGSGSVADRDNAVSVGSAGNERQITNVAAATQGTDAVNLNQLNNAMTRQSNTFNQQIARLQSSINTVSKNAYAGVAAAMAMPNLTPSGPGRTVVAVGGGYYMGGSAAAAGLTYRSTNMRWLMNGSVSVTNTGNAGVRAQVGYEF
jgi:autotransporter adhesin